MNLTLLRSKRVNSL